MVAIGTKHKVSRLCNAEPDLRRFRRAARIAGRKSQFRTWRQLKRAMPLETKRGPKIRRESK